MRERMRPIVNKYRYHVGALDSKDSSGADIPFRVTIDGDMIFTGQNYLTFPHIRKPYLKVGHVEFDEIP